MSEDQAMEMLGALGRVEPPSPRALNDAREALWSAVAGEMLGTDPAAEAGPRPAARPQRPRRRRRADP